MKDTETSKEIFNRLFLDSTMIGLVILMVVGFAGLFFYELPGSFERVIHLGVAGINAFVIYRSWRYLRWHAEQQKGG